MKCTVCGIEEDILLTHPQQRISGDHYCSELHLQTHTEDSTNDPPRKELKLHSGFEEHVEPEILAEQVKTAYDAEFMFFLFTIRALCSSDLAKSLLTKDNLSTTYKLLQREQQTKKIHDFLFITDIFKLALKKDIPAANKTFVVQRVQSILKDAKIAALGSDQAPPEIEREIYSMIAKNTLDTFVDIHVARPLASSQGQVAAMHSLTISEVPIYRRVLDLVESPDKIHKIHVTSLERNYSDILIQNIADTVRSESLEVSDFCIVHKSKRLDLLGDETIQIRRVAVGETIEDWTNGHTYLLARNIGLKGRFDPRNSITVHVHFGSPTFEKEIDLCYNIPVGGSLEEVENRVTQTLNAVFVHERVDPANPVIKFILPEGLRDGSGFSSLFKGRDDEAKVIQIEASIGNIVFDLSREHLIYSPDENRFFQSFVKDIQTPKYLEDLSELTGLSKDEVEGEMKRLIIESSLERLSVEAQETVVSLRCCRILLLAYRTHSLEGLHHLSFLFTDNHHIPSASLARQKGIIPQDALSIYSRAIQSGLKSKSRQFLRRKHQNI